MTKDECGLVDKCPDNPCCQYGCDFYEQCWGDNEMTEKEEYYDEVIAPLLADVAEKCIEKGMSFIGVVEYEKDGRGRTRTLQSDASLEMRMIDHCAKTAPNVDGYIIGLVKYCREKEISMVDSFVLKDFSDKDSEPTRGSK